MARRGIPTHPGPNARASEDASDCDARQAPAPAERKTTGETWPQHGWLAVLAHFVIARAIDELSSRWSLESGARPTLSGVPRAVRSATRRAQCREASQAEATGRSHANAPRRARGVGLSQVRGRRWTRGTSGRSQGGGSPRTRRGAIAAKKRGVSAKDVCACSGLRGRIAVGWRSANERGLHARRNALRRTRLRRFCGCHRTSARLGARLRARLGARAVTASSHAG